jgi:hypothetical protein
MTDIIRPDDFSQKKQKDFQPVVSMIRSGHDFNVKEGDAVILRGLLCVVYGVDITCDKVLVNHEFWGEKWVKESELILVRSLDFKTLMKKIVKFIASGELKKFLLLEKKVEDDDIKKLSKIDK